MLTGTASTFPVAAPYPRSRDSLRFSSAACLNLTRFFSPAVKNRFPPFTCNKQYLRVSIGTSVQTAGKIPPQLLYGLQDVDRLDPENVTSCTSSPALPQPGIYGDVGYLRGIPSVCHLFNQQICVSEMMFSYNDTNADILRCDCPCSR